jgi:hypothetical protein
MRTSFHHQPEAQHPNFQLPASWQADYPIFGDFSEELWCYCNTLTIFEPSATLPGGLLGRIPTHSNELGRVMTISGLLSRDQITANAMEMTDADFNCIEVIGDLIRHTEMMDNERRQDETKEERLAQRSLSLEPR